MAMKKGNLWRSIWIYSVPLMFTNLLQLLFNIADVAIVGKFAGSISLGAVGSTTLLISLTTGWLIGISNGVNAVVAFFAGADERNQEQKAIQTGFLLCLAIGLIIFGAGFLWAEDILELLGTKDEFIWEATRYFRIYMMGSPALAIFNYGNSVLSAEGNTKKPLNYLTISGVVNVVLNLYFVIGLHMTSEGVAYASIIAQYISAALIIRALLITKKNYRIDVRNFSIDHKLSGKILKIGIPAALQYSLFAVANLFVQSAVNSFDYVIVEGNSAAMNFDSIVYEMMAAFYIACTSFVAQNYGANQKERVRKTYFITTVYSFSIAVILGAVIHIFRTSRLYIFTNDAAVVSAGAIRLGILSITYCLSAFMDNATAACRGLGGTLIPTVIVLLGTIAFRIVWIYTVFEYFHTLEVLYLLYGCAFVITAVFQNLYLLKLYRKIFV